MRPGPSTRRSRTAVWMVTGFVVLAVMAGIAGAAYAYQLRGSAAVQHTVEVDVSLARIFSTVQDAETGQRGYLLTGDETFLAPYERSAPAIAGRIATLRTLMQDNPEQIARLGSLEALIREKMAELQFTIDLRERGDTAGSHARVASGEGKRIMDAIHDLVRRMEAHEAELLEERHAAVTRIALTIWGAAAIVAVLIVVMSVSAVREARRRESLARFLPAELADQLADGDDGLRAGRRQDAAIVFVDMRGSTALAESLDPHDLSVFLGAFRRRVSRIAQRHGGVVDKFIGDGALVVFGLPEPRADDAARALAFAQDLVTVVERWSGTSPGAQAVRIGIGVHYGDVFCGIVGQDARLEFTVLGDTVNVAARLEQATKAHATPILASRAACDAAGPAGRDWCEVARTPLRGRKEPMPYCRPPDAPVPDSAGGVAAAVTGSGGALRET